LENEVIDADEIKTLTGFSNGGDSTNGSENGAKPA